MSRDTRRPPPLPSDATILAAFERAQRHHTGVHPAVSLHAAVAHLGLPWHAGTARRLGPPLRRLQDAELVRTVYPQGNRGWELTPTGRRRLRTLRRAGKVDELPESPQHREWRTARELARDCMPDFEQQLSDLLDRAQALLAAPAVVNSDDWLLLADDLKRACRRVGSAIHCRHEWPEPDDRKPDTDNLREPHDKRRPRELRARLHALRHGRRDPAGWEE